MQEKFLKKAIANIIRKTRIERGLSRGQMALSLKVSPQAIYYWESGEKTANSVALLKIMHKYKINLCEIEMEYKKCQKNTVTS